MNLPGNTFRTVRSHYVRELVSWSLLAVALGALEGGVIGVLLKSLFTGAGGGWALNYSVALLTGAPHFCGLLSFLWVRLADGRDVGRFLFRMQVATASCLLLIAAAPTDASGLPMMVAGAVGARLFWSGVVTLRAPVWRRLYPRPTRARLTGTFFAVHSIVMAATGLAVGLILDGNGGAYHAVYAVAAVVGIGGAVLFRGLHMGLHLWLSGLRGLLAPLAGIALYEIIEARAPGQGVWTLTVPAALCALGAIAFARLAARRAGPVPLHGSATATAVA